MNTSPVTLLLDRLADQLAPTAMTIMVKTCRTEMRNASTEKKEAAMAAMRSKAGPIMDTLMSDIAKTPSRARQAFQTAALDLAQAGINVLRKNPPLQ